MIRPQNKMIKLSLILFILFFASLAFSQFEPEKQQIPQTGMPLHGNSIFEPIPPAYWIRFTAFKTVSIIIFLLAFILGFASYFFGSSAGAKVNKREIRKSIIGAMSIAIIARPISNLAHYYLGVGLNFILPEAYAFGIAGFIIYVLWTAYVVSIPVFLYESFTVSAKEAHPTTFTN